MGFDNESHTLILRQKPESVQLIDSIVQVVDNQRTPYPTRRSQASEGERRPSDFPFPTLEEFSHDQETSFPGTEDGLRGWESRR